MHLIVGVDPGTTTGLACIDFSGRVVDLFSSKDLGLDGAVEHLVSKGTVSVVATDVSPAPNFVLRLATKLGAVVYTPAESVQVLDKIALAREHETGDAHQRDALSAALIAYSAHKNKFAKIDSLGLDPRKADEVKHLVLRGFSIDHARSAIASREVRPREEPKKVVHVDKPRPIPESEYAKTLANLEKQNKALREQIAHKDRELRSVREAQLKMRREYEMDIRKNSEVRKRDMSIRSLKSGLHDLRRRLDASSKFRNMWEGVAGGDISPVGLFPKHRKGFVLLRQRLSKEDLDSLSGAYVVFTDEKPNRDVLKEKGILYADMKLVAEAEGCLFVRMSDVEEVKHNAKVSSITLESIVESYRKRKED